MRPYAHNVPVSVVAALVLLTAFACGVQPAGPSPDTDDESAASDRTGAPTATPGCTPAPLVDCPAEAGPEGQPTVATPTATPYPPPPEGVIPTPTATPLAGGETERAWNANDRIAWVAEQVPGFAGVTVEPDDILLVYMAGEADETAAEEAARLYVGERFAEFQEVRVVSVEYDGALLVEWYRRLKQHAGLWDVVNLSGIDESENRIAFRVKGVSDARETIRGALEWANIPEAAVRLESVCASGSYERQPSPDDAALRALDISVVAPDEITAGESANLTLRVTNPTVDTVSVEHGRGHSFVVTAPDGAVVWSTWCVRAVVRASLHQLTLAPGETFTYDNKWHGVDGWGDPLEPGEYFVYGVFSSLPDVDSEPPRVTIAQGGGR